MKSALEQFGIAFFGLVTTIIVVVADLTVAHLIGFYPSSFLLSMIPVGAIAMGAIAASGYYFGSLYTHSRANASLLLLMVVIAGLAQILVFWFDYTLLDDNIKESVSFIEYVIHVTENSQYFVMGRGTPYHHLDDVGWFSYFLSFSQFIGFLLGGFSAYVLLRSKKICPSCNLYLSEIKKRRLIFLDESSVSDYLSIFQQNSMDDSSIATSIDASVTDAMPEEGAIRITTTILGCPVCRYRLINHDAELFVNDEWKDVEGMSLSMELSVSNRSGSNSSDSKDFIQHRSNEANENISDYNRCLNIESKDTDALIEAVISNDLDLVKSLVNKGVNPKTKNEMGYTAIDYARGHGFSDIERYLMNGGGDGCHHIA